MMISNLLYEDGKDVENRGIERMKGSARVKGVRWVNRGCEFLRIHDYVLICVLHRDLGLYTID